MSPARLQRGPSVGDDEAGFTLIEMLVATVILVIAIGAIASMVTVLTKRSQQTVSDVTSQAVARPALDSLVAEIREAYTGDPSTRPIVTMTPTQLTFYTPDRQQPYHLEEISYRLNGGTLQRAQATTSNTGGPPWTPWPLTLGSWRSVVDSIVANSGGSPFFAYQDSSGATTSDPAAVATVIVTMTVSPPGLSSSTKYQESATIRAVSLSS
jgi:prepilin-type N-terminal cleavage/methylation domain-containing protein